MEEPDDVINTGGSGEALIGGTETFERPEVGFMMMGGYCTATLVTPTVVITAAHCVGYGTQDITGDYGSFTMEIGPGVSPRSFRVDRYRSFGSSLGTGDVALLRLSSAVPADVATPAGLAGVQPAHGTPVTVYGYGCNNRDGSGGYVKRKVEFNLGTTNNLCSGDSGGPTMTRPNGPVFRVNSAHTCARFLWWWICFGDWFGEVPRIHGELTAQIAAWEAGPGCGDGACGAGETCSTCPADCGSCPGWCGDGACGAGETCSACPADCGSCPGWCGDGACGAGETCSTCPADCGSCPGGDESVRLRATSYGAHAPDWLYVEWDPLPGTSSYRIDAMLLRADLSSAGTHVTRTPGASDRGAFLYAYVHRDQICMAAPAGGGTFGLRVRLMPNEDLARAAQAEAAAFGALSCGPPPTPSCGDGTCAGGETCSTCPFDCGSCHDPGGPDR